MPPKKKAEPKDKEPKKSPALKKKPSESTPAKKSAVAAKKDAPKTDEKKGAAKAGGAKAGGAKSADKSSNKKGTESADVAEKEKAAAEAASIDAQAAEAAAAASTAAAAAIAAPPAAGSGDAAPVAGSVGGVAVLAVEESSSAAASREDIGLVSASELPPKPVEEPPPKPPLTPLEAAELRATRAEARAHAAEMGLLAALLGGAHAHPPAWLLSGAGGARPPPYTPLCVAAECGAAHVVASLLAAGADVNETASHPPTTTATTTGIRGSRLDGPSATPTRGAGVRGSLDPVAAPVGGSGATALYAACARGHLGVVALLLAHPGVEVRGSDYRGLRVVTWSRTKKKRKKEREKCTLFS
jgi:hypothetical protein